VLLGRERERKELERLLATARTGRSAVLGLVGEPGIGKTALLGHAAQHAGGMRLLRARGVESETHIPFAALLELLRPALGLLERIPAPQAGALEVALALRPGTAGDRFAVGAATLSLLAAYADETPALVLVDDAHLLDAATAEALLFALRRLLAEPLAALLAVRAGEPSLLDDADIPTLALAGLDPGSAAALLGSLPADEAERLYRATGGNPLALLELATEVGELAAVPIDVPVPVPASISQAFARRVEQLEARVQKLLLLVAASDTGELSTLERAAKSLELDLAGLGAGEQAGLLRRAEGRVEFSHPLARAAVYADAAPEARREAHRALADALPDRDADRRAWHVAVAAVGTDANAASALAQAATRARARGAYAVAATAFERAAHLSADDDARGMLLFEAANAAWSGGMAERAAAWLAQAEQLAPDRERLVEIDHLRGRIATRRGPVTEGYAILAAGAERAAQSDPDLAVTMLAEAVDACFFSGDARAMARAAERARELLPAESSVRSRFLATITRGMALVFGGDGETGIAAIRDSVALAERSPELREEDVALLPWLVMGPLWLRETHSGEVLIAAAIEDARAETALGVLPWLLNRIARGHAATESWAAAEVEYDEAMRLARETGQHVERAAAMAGLAWLEARQGRDTRCRSHAAEGKALCRELGVGLYEGWAIRALGELELGSGRPQAAVEQLERHEDRIAELAIADVDLWPAAELVDAYLRLGRRSDAGAAAARLEAAARRKGQPWSLARAERCRGMLAEDSFEHHFEEAVRLHELTPDVFELACTRLAYGARLRRTRQRRRAREELRGALEIFDRLGAEPWSGLARGELSASGESARRRDPSTVDELTPQELQIAQLLAGGKTTREAAAALFLSPKTIEYHLRSIYRKLGVKSRPELAQALTAH
jgi:DNA-binding CsgD family transcriptional regulator